MSARFRKQRDFLATYEFRGRRRLTQMFVVLVLRLQQYFHPVHRGYRRLRHHARDA